MLYANPPSVLTAPLDNGRGVLYPGQHSSPPFTAMK